MAKKKKPREKNISQKNLIIGTLQGGRRLTIPEISNETRLTETGVKKAIWHMLQSNLMEKDDPEGYQGLFWLTVEGEQYAVDEDLQRPDPPPPPPKEVDEKDTQGETPKETPAPKAHKESADVIPLDQRDLLTQRLKAIGVRPTDVIPTIVDIFFTYDINDMSKVEYVFGTEAAGYITPPQKKILVSWWARTRGLPYDEHPESHEEEGKVSEKKDSQQLAPLDLGIGYDVQKRGEEWQVVPGGPMTHKEAWDRLERQKLLDNMNKQTAASQASAHSVQTSPPSQETAVPLSGSPAGGTPDWMNLFMTQMIQSFFEKGDKGGSENQQLVAVISNLQGEIANLKANAQQDKINQLEAAIAQLYNRDPLGEYKRFQEMKAVLGIPEGGPIVTDSSPAVQLIKDSTDKFDKQASRLLGAFERILLKSDQFSPENTRSPEERETMAGHLLEEIEGREGFENLRVKTFGGM